MALDQMNKKRHVIKLKTEQEVAVNLASYIADLSDKIIRQKGYITVVLSGGTLIHTMRELVKTYKGCVNWSKWLVFWVDERVYPLDSSWSNYKLALDGFLSKVPIPAENIYPINYTPDPDAVAVDYESCLKNLVKERTLPQAPGGFPIFDLMLLGIGPDGHIASLFPGHPQRYEKKRWVTFITDSPKPPPPRITFTFPVINAATYIAMVVTGGELADAVRETLGPFVGPMPSIPCKELQFEASADMTWFLDGPAASKLPSD
ncbi:Probable 6-phosphogluconolactonase 5-chloroplastic [Striga hermonthica]|uniref:Probable 6-phosphogluconolactonase n=1 Tax=Striga hermonthica TaxID=68872 RepID=A0A9N7MU46_STRHE|nr:Probable 6-phosphogluconolactonase 5-chloroplastic [Striga hermonthica]